VPEIALTKFIGSARARYIPFKKLAIKSISIRNSPDCFFKVNGQNKAAISASGSMLKVQAVPFTNW